MLPRLAPALLLAVLAVQAQAPAFEVASVKIAESDAPAQTDIKRDPAGGIFLNNVNLRTLVIMAYNLQPFQLAGGPPWLRTKRFNVSAKAPATARKDQTWVMLQALLADRFQLVVHRETKEQPIFELVVAKGGFKIQPAHRPPTEADHFIQTLAGRFKALMAGMPDLAMTLSGLLGHQVVDRTNLDGKYDFELTFAPDDTVVDRPPIYAALQEQLGLKLEPTKGPVQITVIDKAELPTAN